MSTPGTDASIATHIDNVVKRKYARLETGRTMVPTELGTVLVQGYFRIDPDLVLPNVRAAIESQCDLIADGSADRAAVVEHTLTVFARKFSFFVSEIDRMDVLFEANFSTVSYVVPTLVALHYLVSYEE